MWCRCFIDNVLCIWLLGGGPELLFFCYVCFLPVLSTKEDSTCSGIQATIPNNFREHSKCGVRYNILEYKMVSQSCGMDLLSDGLCHCQSWKLWAHHLFMVLHVITWNDAVNEFRSISRVRVKVHKHSSCNAKRDNNPLALLQTIRHSKLNNLNSQKLKLLSLLNKWTHWITIFHGN